MLKIAIIGTTSWGTTLGFILAEKGIPVGLWARTEQEAAELRKKGPDPGLSSEMAFPPQLFISTRLEEVLDEVRAVILVVPSQSMRQNAQHLARYLDKSMLVVSAAKGLEIGSGKRMSQVITEEIPSCFQSHICVLSGPNLAREILRGLPAAAVASAEDGTVARKAQRILTTPNLCVFTNTDVIGVELGGALKNIIALGAGIVDGLGYGDNAKAAFMTRGLTEITALGVALGAHPLTFSGLTGLGDVITTCTSPLSRNHYVGMELTKGRSLPEIVSSMAGVAEGVTTTLVALNLAQKLGLEMPITEKVYQVLYENADPRQVAEKMMGGGTGHELTGRKWKLFSVLRRYKRPKTD
ncbi:MAG: NAD(P)H-dependent glycerol-3-phosphate dehydrogenase [Dehalococcoidales bacterium]|jgi:glycerol-3-phosphate dehydrogenase (NAD(P)+)|nr:NAD(P)H-dependent glycerol-3-phosphate dehydrogenase [Dehalococcoidales bacterium]MDP7286293.1 NAD(P)H-dependent glycerol-3-phosphate dehydrogenase [Dehalococcoidales bacterium]MDP7415467.1 NAD(P)H-dependent glycerol-3-phosphate dehydrogenase [Dehalococcoidales bacterium]